MDTIKADRKKSVRVIVPDLTQAKIVVGDIERSAKMVGLLQPKGSRCFVICKHREGKEK